VKATRDLCRELVLTAVARQGGEWTPGRVKRLFAQHNLTHVYPANIRRLLAKLHAEGALLRHETPGRRYYTPAKDGAQ
jgi:hypothetical protein